jgi:hypothetical protein
MWITVATVNENVNMDLLNLLIAESAADRYATLAEGVETAGYLLPPATEDISMTAFTPGSVFKRAWSSEAAARRSADFINNHPSNQVTVVVERQDV